jgi:hypothetical protein
MALRRQIIEFRCPGGVFPVLPSEASPLLPAAGLFAGACVAAGALAAGSVIDVPA